MPKVHEMQHRARPALDEHGRHRPAMVPSILLGLFVVIWIALAIAPWYREDWLLENVLVFVLVPGLVLAHRRLPFSSFAYSCLFVFFVMHQVGAHYTYAEVPYDRWGEAVLGRSISDLLGLERNHYDRLVHFLYGLLVTPAGIELVDARAPQRGMWRWWLPWFFMVSHATLFEIVEALGAVVFGGDLGEAYLGTQGDVWDSQKDSALAALGAALAVIGVRMTRRRSGPSA
jgi:putative membrane protein